MGQEGTLALLEEKRKHQPCYKALELQGLPAYKTYCCDSDTNAGGVTSHDLDLRPSPWDGTRSTIDTAWEAMKLGLDNPWT